MTLIMGVITVLGALGFLSVGSQVATGNAFQWTQELEGTLLILVIIVIIGAVIVFAFLALYIHYNGRKPALIVAVSPKENYFKERITVHNRNDTAYHYKVRIGKTYLKWQSDIVSSGNKEIATLGPGNGSGVILDDVVYQLADHSIEIEALDWRPFPFRKVVYSRLFRDI